MKQLYVDACVFNIVKELTLLVLLERDWQRVPPLTSLLLLLEM